MELDPQAKEEFERRFRGAALLGKGSFGSVYECQDRLDGHLYAVKVIPKRNVKRSRIDSLRDEAKILSNIEHPNIVKVYEFGETDTFMFLKMELVRSGSLEKLIKRRWEDGRRFTDQQVASAMGAIFRGVNHIHSVSIIHRDIKPDNILLPNQEKLGELKIADFGLSTKLDFHYPKTATSKCGTMLYMAPQILHNYTYTKSVDVWSCAIIMYIFFHGKHPLHQPKMPTEQYKRRIKTVKFDSMPNKLAQDFFSRIARVESSERYSTPQALKHPWITRNSDDEIPLSLHESFSGFEVAHEISKILKTMMAVRHMTRGQQITIPDSYLKKKDYFEQEVYGTSLRKSKSKQSARQLNSLSHMTCALREKQNREQSVKITPVVDTENPTIQKLNSIFDSLFGKRSKLQIKTYSEGMILNYQPKQNITDLPDIADFKDRLQIDIERTIQQFKNCCQPNRKRILPSKATTSQPYHSSIKEEIKGSDKPAYKIRMRKRNSAGMKLYD